MASAAAASDTLLDQAVIWLFSSVSGNETGTLSRHIGTISVKNPAHAESDVIPSHHQTPLLSSTKMLYFLSLWRHGQTKQEMTEIYK